jgi:hypothetical protein
MRLVQRHGRIDRIGSQHKEVFLRTFFPDRELNRLLDLERRVRRKLAQAAASVGVESAPIQGGHEADRAFTETREEIERLIASRDEAEEMFVNWKRSAEKAEAELEAALLTTKRELSLAEDAAAGLEAEVVAVGTRLRSLLGCGPR